MVEVYEFYIVVYLPHCHVHSLWQRSKPKDQALYLECIQQWMDGGVEGLMEGCTIHHQLTQQQFRAAQQTVQLLAKLMMEDKGLILEDNNEGPLHLDRQVDSSTVPEY